MAIERLKGDNTMTEQERIERMRAATAWHLAYNFMPPQPPELVEYCLQAIDACSDNEPDKLIYLPGGLTVTAEKLVEDLRLEDMIDARE